MMEKTPMIEPELQTVARVTIEGGEWITEQLLEQIYDCGCISLTPPVEDGEGACSLLVGMDYGRLVQDKKAVLADG